MPRRHADLKIVAVRQTRPSTASSSGFRLKEAGMEPTKVVADYVRSLSDGELRADIVLRIDRAIAINTRDAFTVVKVQINELEARGAAPTELITEYRKRIAAAVATADC